ncbi:MAG: YtoQ family protein [Balneolales bacterium]|nr:YtoQ family protein [Balneolales bacterium]
MKYVVYLAGEIHSDWRNELKAAVTKSGTDKFITFTTPVTNHDASDNCGVHILGPESDSFWKDHKGAGVNSLRTKTLIKQADIVVVRFGEKYRQWNAAFDAGFASALGKQIIIIHPHEFDHALKEVDEAASVVARTNEQAAEVLSYIVRGELN